MFQSGVAHLVVMLEYKQFSEVRIIGQNNWMSDVITGRSIFLSLSPTRRMPLQTIGFSF